MAMHKIDFEAVADAVATAKVHAQHGGEGIPVEQRAEWVLMILTGELAKACAARSAQFDRDRFVKACGFPAA